MRIALDLEMTLADTQQYLVRMYNATHETSYRTSDIDSWFWVSVEIDFDEFMEIVQIGWEEEWYTLKPCESNLHATVEELSEYGEVDIVTARTGVEKNMELWLALHGITGYTELVSIPHSESKADLNYDVYIDDNPLLFDDLYTHQKGYLIKRSYNRDQWMHRRATPVGTVKEVLWSLKYGVD